MSKKKNNKRKKQYKKNSIKPKTVKNKHQKKSSPNQTKIDIIKIKEKVIEEEKQRQIELEKQRQIELEKQRQIELEKQRQIELEKQRQIELEKQRQIELEKQRQIELEKQRQIEELNHKKEIKKKRIKRIIWTFTIIILLCIIVLSALIINKEYLMPKYSKKPYVIDVYLENENIKVSTSEPVKCSLNKIEVDSNEWIESINNICTFDFQDSIKTVYIKDKYNRIIEHNTNNEFSILDDITVNKSTYYLAINAKDKIEYNIIGRGKINDKVTFTSNNPKIVSVTEDGAFNTLQAGETDIVLTIRDKEVKVHILVTDLITTMPTLPNVYKSLLPCERYTEEENNLLDKILKDRVYTAGYKTRAGAVAAARFLVLEFPYRLTYFSENGRMGGWPQVDAEGRYNHEGLYLHSSRFANVEKSMYGPQIWGCPLYSAPAEGERKNGLDCSGFITWILRQAGFDTGDVGAGVTAWQDDMTDLGPLKRIPDAIQDGSLKVGDLLSGDGENPNAYDGGHIAFLAGIKDNNYYVAEELWFNDYFGAIIKKYDEESFKYYFYWQVDLKDFYEGDGNLTNFWE